MGSVHVYQMALEGIYRFELVRELVLKREI